MKTIALIHGFGMPVSIFDDLIEQLSANFNCINIKLPGDAKPSNHQTFDDYLDFILAQIPDAKPIILLGWSLGGMLAIKIASRYPKRVRQLILVATTPKFTQLDDWQDAVTDDNLSLFFNQITNDYQKTIRQFLALQTMGAPNQKALIKTLSRAVKAEPDLNSLKVQLSFLQTFDLRKTICKITTPTLWLAGQKDKLTPATASIKASKMMLNSDFYVIEKSGHLPFYTHNQEFLAQLLKWTQLN